MFEVGFGCGLFIVSGLGGRGVWGLRVRFVRASSGGLGLKVCLRLCVTASALEFGFMVSGWGLSAPPCTQTHAHTVIHCGFVAHTYWTTTRRV